MPVSKAHHAKIYGNTVGYLNRKDVQKKKKNQKKSGLVIPMPEFELAEVRPTSPSNGDFHLMRQERLCETPQLTKRSFDPSIPKEVPLQFLARKVSLIGYGKAVNPADLGSARDQQQTPFSSRKKWSNPDQIMPPPPVQLKINHTTNLETNQWIGKLREEKFSARKKSSPIMRRPRQNWSSGTKDEFSPRNRASRAKDPWHHLPNSARKKELDDEERRMIEASRRRDVLASPEPLQITAKGGSESKPGHIESYSPPLPRSPKFEQSTLRQSSLSYTSPRTSPLSSGRTREDLKIKWQRKLPKSRNLKSPVKPAQLKEDGRWPQKYRSDDEFMTRKIRHAYEPTPEPEPIKRKRKPKKNLLIESQDDSNMPSLALPSPDGWQEPLETEDTFRDHVDTLMKPDYNLPQVSSGGRKFRKSRVHKSEEVEEKEDFNQTTSTFTVFDEEAAAEVRREEERLKKQKELERKKKMQARQIYVLENDDTGKFLASTHAKIAAKKAKLEKRKMEKEERNKRKAEEKRRKDEARRRQEEEDKIIYNEMDYVEFDDEELNEKIPGEDRLSPEALEIKKAMAEQRAKLRAKVRELEARSKNFKKLVEKEHNRIRSQHEQAASSKMRLQRKKEAEEERHRKQLEGERERDRKERERLQALERKRLEEETAKRLAEEEKKRKVEKEEISRKAALAAEDERMLEGVEIDTCPISLGAPPCKTGPDNKCVQCGGIPTRVEADYGDEPMCPMYIGKTLCPPGPDGTCRACGVRVRDAPKRRAPKGDEDEEEGEAKLSKVEIKGKISSKDLNGDDYEDGGRTCEGLVLESCPMSLGAPICAIGEDGRCIKCGCIPSDEHDVEREDDRKPALYCPLELGKKACPPDPSGKCEKCGMLVDNAGGSSSSQAKNNDNDDNEDLEFGEGNHIHLFCPMSMGQEACPPSSPDGRCGICGVRVAESTMKEAGLEVSSDKEGEALKSMFKERSLLERSPLSKKPCGEDMRLLSSFVEATDYCPISMGAELCCDEASCYRCGRKGVVDKEGTRKPMVNERSFLERSPLSRDSCGEDVRLLSSFVEATDYCPISMGAELCCDEASCYRCGRKGVVGKGSAKVQDQCTALPPKLNTFRFNPNIHECLSQLPNSEQYCPISMGSVLCAPSDCTCGFGNHVTRNNIDNVKRGTNFISNIKPLKRTFVATLREAIFSGRSSEPYCPLTMGAKMCASTENCEACAILSHREDQG